MEGNFLFQAVSLNNIHVHVYVYIYIYIGYGKVQYLQEIEFM